MRRLTVEARKAINSDPFYESCALCGQTPVQIHHNLIFANQQVDDLFQLIPLCFYHHENIWRRIIKRQVDRVMVERANESDIARYPHLFSALTEKVA